MKFCLKHRRCSELAIEVVSIIYFGFVLCPFHTVVQETLSFKHFQALKLTFYDYTLFLRIAHIQRHLRKAKYTLIHSIVQKRTKMRAKLVNGDYY